jgi:lipopolysaccharide transport system ATP-binding protein
MSDIAISVSHVSKCYRVFDDPSSRLLHAIWPARTKGMQEMWALKDINCEIKRGESVAIIGRNGSGKSTLLEILTGTLMPTTGDVRVNGRVSALLELGSGFNPEYSGRDNVILNGLLLGLSKDDILSRFDEIEAFAEIGAAIDRPVKTYSSGMMMRLAFSVQVLCDPDILIVDEALSVGDFFFQQKCLGHIRQLCENGMTLLFVSHDMGVVRDFCERAIFLQHGKAVFLGDTRLAIQNYLNEERDKSPKKINDENGEASLDNKNKIFDRDLISEGAIWARPYEENSRLIAIHLQNEFGKPTTHVRIGELLIIQVAYSSLKEDVGTTLSLAIKNRYDQTIYVTTANRLGIEHCDMHHVPFLIFKFEIKLNLEAGLYSFRVGVNQPTGFNKTLELDSTNWLGPFCVEWDYEAERAPFLGMFGLTVNGNFITDIIK